MCVQNPVTVRVLDRQDGIDIVLDHTKKINKNDYSFRYSIPLNNSYFSVPFTASTGKARIIRNKISGFFHFYVSVGKEIDGKFHENWIELAQSKDWGGQGQNYFICPIVRNGNENSTEVNFSDIRFEEFSAEMLRTFEDNLYHHIHLENNIVFPKAIELQENCERMC